MKEGWTYKKLGEVCEIFGRIGFRGYTKADLVDSPNDGAITLSPSNIVNGEMDYSKCSYITWAKYEESPEIMIYPGDILLVKTASVGKTALVRDLPHKATINPQFVVFKNIETNHDYLSYYMKSEKAQKYIWSIAKGAAAQTVSQKNLAEMQVPVPTKAEQQRIVSRLDSAFAHIDELKANAEKQLSEAHALFQKALTKAMKPKEGWEEKKMGDVCEVNRGRSKHRPRNDKRLYGGNYPFIQTGDIHNAHGGILKSYSQTYSDFGLAQSRLWKKGTICITIAANIGETAILGMDACFPDSVVGIYPNEVLLNAHFLNYYLVSIKESIDKLSYGTAQKNINLEILNNLLVYLPPLSEQQRIVSCLDSLSAHVRELEEVTQKTIAECDALKQALLRKVFE